MTVINTIKKHDQILLKAAMSTLWTCSNNTDLTFTINRRILIKFLMWLTYSSKSVVICSMRSSTDTFSSSTTHMTCSFLIPYARGTSLAAIIQFFKLFSKNIKTNKRPRRGRPFQWCARRSPSPSYPSRHPTALCRAAPTIWQWDQALKIAYNHIITNKIIITKTTPNFSTFSRCMLSGALLSASLCPRRLLRRRFRTCKVKYEFWSYTIFL